VLGGDDRDAEGAERDTVWGWGILLATGGGLENFLRLLSGKWRVLVHSRSIFAVI